MRRLMSDCLLVCFRGRVDARLGTAAIDRCKRFCAPVQKQTTHSEQVLAKSMSNAW